MHVHEATLDRKKFQRNEIQDNVTFELNQHRQVLNCWSR